MNTGFFLFGIMFFVGVAGLRGLRGWRRWAALILRAMVVLGVFGLVSLVAFLAVANSGANVLIGLVERCAVYPVLIGFLCAGVSIWNRRPAHTLHEHGRSMFAT